MKSVVPHLSEKILACMPSINLSVQGVYVQNIGILCQQLLQVCCYFIETFVNISTMYCNQDTVFNHLLPMVQELSLLELRSYFL